MRHVFVVLLVGATAACAAPAAPQPKVPAQPRAGTPLPAQQAMIGLSLVDALVAVHQESLAGVFGYIAEANAAPAFADYLFRNPKALKLFLKKGEGDFKRTGGVSQWDKEVFLYLVTIQSNASLVGAPIPDKVFDRVTTLSLAPGLPLAAIKMGGAH